MVSLPTGTQSMFLLNERLSMAAKPIPVIDDQRPAGIGWKGQLHPPETQ
jgi:hypothetical protein